MQENSIFKGDDTRAFGGKYITINVRNPHLEEISKIIFSVNGGLIVKTFTDPSNFKTEDIELIVNFDSQETAKLNASNVGNLIAYDMENQQCTCQQSITFTAKNGVLCKNGRAFC